MRTQWSERGLEHQTPNHMHLCCSEWRLHAPRCSSLDYGSIPRSLSPRSPRRRPPSFHGLKTRRLHGLHGLATRRLHGLQAFMAFMEVDFIAFMGFIALVFIAFIAFMAVDFITWLLFELVSTFFNAFCASLYGVLVGVQSTSPHCFACH